MDKRVILSVAGAGKTYYICHTINPCKKNLILAFTNENIHNIRKELLDAYGRVPELTNVMTFDSFVYRYLLKPYEPSILQHFGCSDFISCGITTIEPPKQRIKSVQGKMVPNKKYIPKDKFGHYISMQRQYYCATLSELILQIKNSRESLVNRAALSMNLFYDQVLIDEFQDFREYDYDLIVGLAKKLNNLTLVGDYYQHSVSALNNSGKPFENRKGVVGYDEFLEGLKKQRFSVDTETLKKSRRCSPDVCEYVKCKLKIDIESNGDNVGSVIWADDNAVEIIENPNILKLVIMDAAKYNFWAMNWSYSKGDTVDNACVILTEKFEDIDAESFSIKEISISTINRLYVAMTRTKGDLYLIKHSTFKKLKSLYLKKN